MDSLCESFTERDDFNRKAIAENLIKLLTSNDINISPMVIDGGWGTGKSEFCLKTISLIRDNYPNDYHVVYVDAFKSDHTGEPLLSLLGEVISTCCPEHKQNDFIDKMGKAAGFLLKKVSKAAIHYVVKESCDGLHEEFQEALNGTSDSIIDYSVNALLKDQVESEKKLKTLQDSLREISNDKKIIIFIDELDRCRPDYAIDMLETIKHVFNIDKIKVVLVTNLKQLSVAIDHRYGHVVDTHHYLEKFIKYKIMLYNSLYFNNKYFPNSLGYFIYLVFRSKILKEIGFFSSKKTLKLLSDLIRIHNISLRQIEKVVLSLEIYQTVADDNKKMKNSDFEGYKCVYIFCHLAYILDPDLLNDINSNNVSADKVASFLGLDSILPSSVKGGLNERGMLLVTLLNNCNSNKERYIPFDKEYWISLYRQEYFSSSWRGYDPFEDEQPFYLFAQVINTLSFFK